MKKLKELYKGFDIKPPYPTGLVERVKNIGEMTIEELENDEIVTLLLQKMCLDRILPLVFERLNHDHLAGEYEGQLLSCLSMIFDDAELQKNHYETIKNEIIKHKIDEISLSGIEIDDEFDEDFINKISKMLITIRK